MIPQLQFWMTAMLSLFGTLIVVVFTAWFRFNTRALSAQMGALPAEPKTVPVAVRAEFRTELAGVRDEMGVPRAELKQAVAELERRLSKQILEPTQRGEHLEEARDLARA